ncbi:MAG: class II fructose-bisphosphatase [Candidatus Bipolaricaulota bacterium]|nr:class II fructose-bisphosphatase [Candidatus Bipolaricaulota bacterium]
MATPTRNLALELVRVTEAAALAAGRFMGRGDKAAADHAAVEAMRLMLTSVDMDGVVVIGEGEKDEAPMLYRGERVGTGAPPAVDLAVDPIDGTRPLATGNLNAISTVALAPRGTMFDPGPIVYMDKIAVGPAARGKVDLSAPVEANLRAIARAKGDRVEDLTVIILDRPRHEGLIAEVRRLKARIRLIPDGDVAAALMTAWPESGIDVLLGIGGSPEGVLAACALRAMGGEIQGRLVPRNEEERRRGLELGHDFDRVLTTEDLVASDDVCFAATGITDGELLRGVKYSGGGATTDSLVVRGLSGTVRRIQAVHGLEKLNRLSAFPY